MPDFYEFACPGCGDEWSVPERDLDGEPRTECRDCGANLNVNRVEVKPHGD